ncbi:conserved hypothetical protein [Histoplasma capsulatum H143]|uniref:Uncharacterized protein n=1 Tax=Ajellomyces capsulatus (strain H143) TaxID=544712 RepID=C6HTK0_AJECH|nr:conserved hypothetical protein [Histoplasma capsulatum H143]
MDQAVRDNARLLENDFLDICKDILLHLLLNDTIKNISKNVTGYMKEKDNKNIKKCTACKKEGHDEPNCWFKHPEK